MGSYQEGNKKKWNRIGALFHLFILVVYIFHWNFFATLPNGEATRSMGEFIFKMNLNLSL
ncbi:hypothetical protein FH589_01885 (plasmid) [Leptospira interrogans]|uniref:Uncharacterized protein n=1 Tax=Leptospira interrogans str. UI 12621 TaxID=1049937 RepID=A0A0F6H5W5_LEPIR